MGNGGLSNFSRFASRQELWHRNGKREIEPPPEQPELSADAKKWLEENNKPKPRPPARLNHATQSRKP
jgi:hypothetical protein